MTEGHPLAHTLSRLRQLAHAWLERCSRAQPPPDDGATAMYADLMFAYGFARFGAASASASLLQEAENSLTPLGTVHQLLARAFRHRIEQAATGPARGGLPPQWKQDFEALAPFSRESDVRYAIDRLREQSKILEPEESIDPFRHLRAFPTFESDDGKHGTIDSVLRSPVSPRRKLDRLTHLLRREATAAQAPSAQALHEVVDFLGTLTPPAVFCAPDDKWVLATMGSPQPAMPTAQTFIPRRNRAESREIKEQIEVIGKAFPLVPLTASAELVRGFVGAFLGLLAQPGFSVQVEDCHRSTEACVTALLRRRMTAELDALIQLVRQVRFQGRSLAELRAAFPKFEHWAALLADGLALAPGLVYLGRVDEALAVLDEVALLLSSPKRTSARWRFARGYIQALGKAPVDLACERFEALLLNLANVTVGFTTSKYFSLTHLDVVESVVLTLLELADRESVRRQE